MALSASAAQIFLLGAEFTKVYANEHGSVAGARAVAATRAAAEASRVGTDDPDAPRTLQAGVAQAQPPALARRARRQAVATARRQKALAQLAFRGLLLALTALASAALARAERREQGRSDKQRAMSQRRGAPDAGTRGTRRRRRA